MKRFISLLLIVLFVFMTACGAQSGVATPKGKWAYIHDEETPILVLKSGGKAVYHGDNYIYTLNDGYMELLADNTDVLKLRYTMDGEDMYLYEHTTYTYSGEGEPDGLVGLWIDEADNWEFEFTDAGTFREDGYFPGYYSVDEAAGTFKLMYNDQFEDTVCYYAIEGNELLVEYPWHMVRAK